MSDDVTNKEEPQSDDPWLARIKEIGDVVFRVVQMILLALSPLLTALVLYYQSHNKAEIQKDIIETKEVLADASEKAGEHAKTAANEAKEARALAEGTREISAASLQQWKAFNTRDPHDMDNAAQAIRRVETFSDLAAEKIP